MDIIDTQIHLFMTMTDDQAVAAMDALGIQAALIDEVWQLDESLNDTVATPGYRLANGVFRPTSPGGMAASMRRPDRFSFLLRVHADDPEIEAQIAEVKACPQARAIRLDARGEVERKAAQEGARQRYFELVSRYDLPVFVMTWGDAASFEQYIRALPDLRIVIDHCGVPSNEEEFQQTLALAKYPNAHLKWSHAPMVFSAQRYPFPEVRPFLDRALEAFGRERVMWASDFTVIPAAAKAGLGTVEYSWAEALFYMRDNPSLSDDDKAWVLGRSARKLLDWPLPVAS
jgi:predicted TIM-barrel fold metal-dependent hydrolase